MKPDTEDDFSFHDRDHGKGGPDLRAYVMRQVITMSLG